MTPLRYCGWRGYVLPGYEAPAVVDRLITIQETIGRGDATVFQNSGGRTVAMIRLMVGGSLVSLFLKEDNILRSGLRAILKSHLRPPHLRQTWRRTLQLRAAGVAVPAAVALLERRRWGVLHTALYAGEYIPGAVQLTKVLHGDSVSCAKDGGLMESLAKALRTMHDRGFYHSDLKADNILVEHQADRWIVTFIDLEGVVAKRSLTELDRAIDLGRLWWSLSALMTRADWEQFFEIYTAIAPPLDQTRLARLIDRRVDYLIARRFGSLPKIGSMLRDGGAQPQQLLLVVLGTPREVDALAPLLTVLRRGLPNIQVDVMVSAGVDSALANNTDVRMTMTFPSALGTMIKTVGAIRSRHYDVVVDVTNSLRSALLARTTGASIRIGYRTASTLVKWLKRTTCYTHMIMARTGQRELAHHYLLLAEALGLGGAGTAARVLLTPEDRRETAHSVLGGRV